MNKNFNKFELPKEGKLQVETKGDKVLATISPLFEPGEVVISPVDENFGSSVIGVYLATIDNKHELAAVLITHEDGTKEFHDIINPLNTLPEQLFTTPEGEDGLQLQVTSENYTAVLNAYVAASGLRYLGRPIRKVTREEGLLFLEEMKERDLRWNENRFAMEKVCSQKKMDTISTKQSVEEQDASQDTVTLTNAANWLAKGTVLYSKETYTYFVVDRVEESQTDNTEFNLYLSAVVCNGTVERCDKDNEQWIAIPKDIDSFTSFITTFLDSVRPEVFLKFHSVLSLKGFKLVDGEVISIPEALSGNKQCTGECKCQCECKEEPVPVEECIGKDTLVSSICFSESESPAFLRVTGRGILHIDKNGEAILCPMPQGGFKYAKQNPQTICDTYALSTGIQLTRIHGIDGLDDKSLYFIAEFDLEKAIKYGNDFDIRNVSAYLNRIGQYFVTDAKDFTFSLSAEKSSGLVDRNIPDLQDFYVYKVTTI